MNEATLPRRAGRRARTVALIFVASVAFLAYAWLLFYSLARVVRRRRVRQLRLRQRGAADLAGRVVEPVEALKHLTHWCGLFIPLAFEPGPRPATMVPFYPPGMPLHVAFAALVGGWNYGPFVVSPLRR